MYKEDHPIRHPIRFKIFLVSLVPTVALVAAALMNSQYLSALGDSAEQILSKNYKSIRAAQETRKVIEAIRNQLLVNVSQNGVDFTVSDEQLAKLDENLRVCRENVTEAGEQELIAALYESYGVYQQAIATLQTIPDLWQSGPFVHFLNLTAEMVARVDELVAINETAMERAEQETRRLANQAQRNAAILFGIIITGILALSYFLSYRIAEPIMTLARKLLETREGSGIYPEVRPRTGDEIGFLTQSFNRLFDRLRQYDQHRDEIIASEREKVRRSEEAKGRFIADISHQLKTPMTSLGMSVGMLQSRGDALGPEKRATLVATAHDDCTRLTALVNELVDASRLEAMSQPRPKETLDIASLMHECLAPLMKQAEARGIAIDMDISPDLPQVTIDSFRFPWVITNLVGNALRYTDRGGRIGLNVYKEGQRFYFQCLDTGSGINPQFLPHIFDRFTQFSERGRGGTIGLGLAIVKDIIEQHGGDIEVESTVGQGTCFTFWIPADMEERREKGADYRR